MTAPREEVPAPQHQPSEWPRNLSGGKIARSGPDKESPASWQGCGIASLCFPVFPLSLAQGLDKPIEIEARTEPLEGNSS